MTHFRVWMATAVVAGTMLFAGCGDGGKAAREKAIADSTAQADSLASIAREDSIAAAEAAAQEASNAPRTVVSVADSTSKTLGAAIKAAELEPTLKSEGPFTVFAPTDQAFTSIKSTVDNLLKPENQSKLQSLLKGHVIAGAFKSTSLKDGQIITTAEGTKLKIKIAKGKVSVNGANVVAADIQTPNGIVHVIDKVLK